ncbi:MAG: DUF423 domain-containing protein [Verrucomicrobiota bacterium]
MKFYSQIISRVSALTGAALVVAGAFGAHALKETLVEAEMYDVWRTASMYGLIHSALAMLWCYLDDVRKLPALFWLVGVYLFSGSLYGLALGGPGILGPVTPLGGLCFIVGWIAAIFGRKPAG